MWDKTQIPPKIQKPKYLRKKKKKYSEKARQGHLEHACKISGSISQKRRGHWTLNEFWGCTLEAACIILHAVFYTVL